MAKGKRTCPNCNTESSVRNAVCKKCNHEFVKSEVVSKKTTYTTGGRGKKECPKCHIYNGARVSHCSACGYDFKSSAVKKEDKKGSVSEEPKAKPEVESKKADLTESILKREVSSTKENTPAFIPSKDMTPKEHAQRILDYGKERAKSLLNQHRWSKSWGHVDWGFVESNL